MHKRPADAEIQGYFCPLVSARKLAMGGRYRLEAGELVRRCPHCDEYLPADTEFFYTNHFGLLSWCIACFNEARQERRRAA